MRREISFLIVDETKNNEFEAILNLANITFKEITLKQFLNITLNQFTSIIFLPGYFEWGKDLLFKEKILTKIKKFRDRGGGFYGEYIQSDDYILADKFIFKQNYPPRPVGLERIFVSEKHYITSNFSKGTILPVRDTSFLPGQPRGQVILSFASILGTHKVLYNLPEKREIWPALLSLEGKTKVIGEGGSKIEGKRWLFATFQLSKYKEKNFPLQKSWEKILKRIVLYLIPEK